MHIETIRVRNFRRLKDVRIDFAKDISIFVGANNSGKTSAAHAIALFLGDEAEAFTVHDFSADTWAQMNAFGDKAPDSSLPTISLDLWLSVGAGDVHRAFELLPSVSWQGSTIGVRVELAPSDPAATLQRFEDRRASVLAAFLQEDQPEGAAPIDPSPRNMHEFLTSNLRAEYGLRYFVLDRAKFDAEFKPEDGYSPQPIDKDKGRSGREVLASLIKVDMLYAQRHLSDASGGARAEDLTKRIGHIYGRSAADRGNDPAAVRALMNAETQFNDHLKKIFAPFLEQLGQLGYPGITNPHLVIRSTLNPVGVLSSADGAQVHYALSEEAAEANLTLPDRYNGLGYKNLIYMVVQLFDLHSQWLGTKDNRPPLHLVVIEEPEAHLHMQLQQVFIKKVLDILLIDGEDAASATSQVVVTTHSSHIVYERGFVPIRYFRRHGQGAAQSSQVLNLSRYYDQLGAASSEFLVRYLKLTHCDLFFADAAILVEGNVERILLPQMIESAAERLRTTYLSILEVGGAYAHIFKSLIEFLGVTALIITDIDSVRPPMPKAVPAAGDEGAAALAEAVAVPAEANAVVAAAAANGQAEAAVPDDEPEEIEGDDDGEGAGQPKAGTACVVSLPNAVTSNRTLIDWLPGKSDIGQLLAATADERTQQRNAEGECQVRVTYQTAIELVWREETKLVAGRTLEEAFALENFAWTQHKDRKDLHLRLRGISGSTIDEIVEKVHKKVSSSGFKKTSFALGLLGQNPADWKVPSYIREGLEWLAEELVPTAAQPEVALIAEPDIVLEVAHDAPPEVDGAP